MSALDGDWRVTRDAARGRRGRHAVRAALIATLGALAIGVGADRWYATRVASRARADVRTAAAIHADALASSTARELSLLLALVSFTESRESRAELDAEFPTFAQGVFSDQGLRALQLVEAGRIVSTWPLEGNRAALGYDLTRHPDPRVRADFERARRSSVVTITGPIALVQGGLGLLVRQRIDPRPGFPDLAAVILDVPRLVAGVGIPDPASGLNLELRDRAGVWFAGDPLGSAVAPESLDVVTVDGNFRLLAAPTAGWASRTAPAQRRWRGGLAVLVVLAGLIGWLIGRRRDRLEIEVTRSSTALRLVMRQSRMGGWEEDLATGQVRWDATMEGLVGRRSGAGPADAQVLLGTVDALDRERLGAALDRARTGQVDEFVEEVRVGGGPFGGRWVLIVGSVSRDEAGRRTRLTCIVADAGEQRALEERVRHAQRLEALAKLASGVARDFTEVLSSIIAAAESARARAASLPPDDAAVVRDDIAQVIVTAHRGSRLTEQLLTFSRGPRVDPPAIDVVASVAELVPTFERLLAGRATLVHERAAGVPRVLIDAGQFTQVLMNLIVNARDAMPEGGTIRVRTVLVTASTDPRPAGAPPGNWVVVEVQDEGTGIPDHVRERIFEPYFTTKSEGRGTGLGLSVVVGIIEAVGGTVTVNSAEGRGSTFRIFFPPCDAGVAR